LSMKINRLPKISGYLQSLTTPEYCRKVEEAMEKKDKESLVQICRSAKIPDQFLGTIVSLLFSMSVSPNDKYPDFL